VLANTSRVREQLEQYGLDALALALPVSVAYATGHECSFETTFRGSMLFPTGGPERFFRSFAVLSANGEAALVSHAALAVTSYLDWNGALEVYGGEGFDPALAADVPVGLRPLAGRIASRTVERGPMEALAAAISAVAPGARRIGVEEVGLLPPDLPALRGSLATAVEFRDASVLAQLIRMVKTADEIERLTVAAEIGELGLRALIDAAEPGVDLAALCDRFRVLVAERGAEYDHVAVGPRGLGIGLRRHIFEPDDVTMLDVGCRFRGCVSDTGVTIALSRASGRVEEEYAALLASVEAGRARLRPGERVVDVYRAMRASVDGSPASASKPQGHGLGQEPKELPFIAPVAGERLVDECVDLDADIVLEEGMVINLEVPLEVPGSRSLQIEQSFVIAAGGADPLVPQRRDRVESAGSLAGSPASS
jgi:Xaa-Pro dipeptidase